MLNLYYQFSPVCFCLQPFYPASFLWKRAPAPLPWEGATSWPMFSIFKRQQRCSICVCCTRAHMIGTLWGGLQTLKGQCAHPQNKTIIIFPSGAGSLHKKRDHCVRYNTTRTQDENVCLHLVILSKWCTKKCSQTISASAFLSSCTLGVATVTCSWHQWLILVLG